jgi:hypothetical protein
MSKIFEIACLAVGFALYLLCMAFPLLDMLMKASTWGHKQPPASNLEPPTIQPPPLRLTTLAEVEGVGRRR